MLLLLLAAAVAVCGLLDKVDVRERCGVPPPLSHRIGHQVPVVAEIDTRPERRVLLLRAVVGEENVRIFVELDGVEHEWHGASEAEAVVARLGHLAALLIVGDHVLRMKRADEEAVDAMLEQRDARERASRIARYSNTALVAVQHPHSGRIAAHKLERCHVGVGARARSQRPHVLGEELRAEQLVARRASTVRSRNRLGMAVKSEGTTSQQQSPQDESKAVTLAALEVHSRKHVV